MAGNTDTRIQEALSAFDHALTIAEIASESTKQTKDMVKALRKVVEMDPTRVDLETEAQRLESSINVEKADLKSAATQVEALILTGVLSEKLTTEAEDLMARFSTMGKGRGGASGGSSASEKPLPFKVNASCKDCGKVWHTHTEGTRWNSLQYFRQLHREKDHQDGPHMNETERPQWHEDWRKAKKALIEGADIAETEHFRLQKVG
jgi:hypothetical protein